MSQRESRFADDQLHYRTLGTGPRQEGRAIEGNRHHQLSGRRDYSSAIDGARQKNSSWMSSGSRKVSIALGDRFTSNWPMIEGMARVSQFRASNPWRSAIGDIPERHRKTFPKSEPVASPTAGSESFAIVSFPRSGGRVGCGDHAAVAAWLWAASWAAGLSMSQ